MHFSALFGFSYVIAVFFYLFMFTYLGNCLQRLFSSFVFIFFMKSFLSRPWFLYILVLIGFIFLLSLYSLIILLSYSSFSLNIPHYSYMSRCIHLSFPLKIRSFSLAPLQSPSPRSLPRFSSLPLYSFFFSPS